MAANPLGDAMSRAGFYSGGIVSTTSVKVDFTTRKTGDIPRVGQRKSVRVNGRIEKLYVRHVEVTAFKDYEFPDGADGRGRVFTEYQGTAIMCEHDRLYR
jgi:hypothetical protein